MERYLLSAYRKLVPNRLKRALTPEVKSRVLEMLLYLTARPGLADLRLRRLAMGAERRGDWAAAMTHWQRLALISHPDPPDTDADTELDRLPVGLTQPQPDAPEEDGLRKARYALAGLRRARAHHALTLYDQGRGRAGDELVARVIESLPDHRILKNDPAILAAARTWCERALCEDGWDPNSLRTGHQRGADHRPRTIVFCLDILKISKVHTHSRVLFAICRNLAELDPSITTHLVITNERFAATTPIVSESFSPLDKARARARAALGDLYGRQFHLHMYERPGLEGVVAACRDILALDPDVVLYGGGHRGFFSNESRLVRHVLYAYLPTAFFYIQSNNQVDARLDMIIARGPHGIDGDRGTALVRAQPYPTIVADEDNTPPPAVDPRRRTGKVIVSAIAGLRMNQRLAQQDRATLETLFTILDQVPGAVWHFIGAADPEALARDLPVIGKRVARGQIVIHPVLGFDDFKARVGAAALFVHPPGFTGGSGGAAVARAAGVPILTCRDSDVSGRQPPETVFDVSDMKGLARKAVDILTSDAAWAAVVSAQISHKQWIRDTAAQGFYECLTETQRAFTTRVGDQL